ncbi:MAG: LmeA family phospholipid-binding protein [Bacillota bacterium]
MKKVFLTILILAVFSFLIFQFYVIGMVEEDIKSNLSNYFSESKELEVDASSFPAWEVLRKKRVDHLNIKADYFILDGLKFDNFSGEYSDVSYDKNLINGENTSLYFSLSEESLTKYLRSEYEKLKDFEVNLNENGVILNGKVNIFNSEIELNLVGSIKLENTNEIVYTPNEFKVEEVELPLSTIKDFTGEMSFIIDLGEYNIPIKVDKIRSDENKIELSGGQSSGKAG